MSKLPRGWVEATLGEIVDDVPTFDPSAFSEMEFTYFDISSIDNEAGLVTKPKRVLGDQAPSRARQAVQKGDVLFSTVRPNLRAIAQVPTATNPIASTGFCVLRASVGVDAKFIFYFARSDVLLQKVLPLQRGVSYPAVREKDVLSQVVPLPPTNEQSRIVEKIEELLSDLDSGVAELKVVQKKLLQYRQSLFIAAVEGALTGEWRKHNKPKETGLQLLKRVLSERRARWEEKRLAESKEQGRALPKGWRDKYPEPSRPDTSGLPELPDGWVWASVDECCIDETSVTDGPFGSNLKSSHYEQRGPRVIRLQNIGDGEFIDAKAHISESHYSELLKHAVRENDVVVAMLGEVLPRACVVPNGVAPAIVKADCARVRLNDDLILPDIVVAQLNSKPTRDRVARLVKGIGRPRINLTHLRRVPIAICSMDEQKELQSSLAKGLLSMRDQSKAIAFSLRQGEAQRRNILNAAFSGQLVPQNPSDEPADVLLQRIRTERAARAPQLRRRRARASKESISMKKTLTEVLVGAGDWLPAQEAFRRCGIADGAETADIEPLYSELRQLDRSKKVAVESVRDEQGHKQYDRLKWVAKD